MGTRTKLTCVPTQFEEPAANEERATVPKANPDSDGIRGAPRGKAARQETVCSSKTVCAHLHNNNEHLAATTTRSAHSELYQFANVFVRVYASVCVSRSATSREEPGAPSMPASVGTCRKPKTPYINLSSKSSIEDPSRAREV